MLGSSTYSTGASSFPESVAFSPDGELVASANNGTDSLSMFVVGAGGGLAPITGSLASSTFSAGANAPNMVAFSPNGELLATPSAGTNSVVMFTVGMTGALTPVTGTLASSTYSTGANSYPYSVAFSPNGELLAAANYFSGSVAVFAVGAGGELTPITGALSTSTYPTGDSPTWVAFSPSGELLATANQAGSVSMFTVAALGALTPVTGTLVSSTFPTPIGSQPAMLAFSPSGDQLATANNTATDNVTVFTVGPSGVLAPANGTLSASTFTTGSSGNNGSRVAFSPNGELLAVANISGNNVSLFYQAPPTATIASPAANRTFTLNQSVPTAFSCSEGASGPGIASCTDSAGASGTSGTLNTSTIGTHTYSVTATSEDGLTATTQIGYTVTNPPGGSGSSAPPSNEFTIAGKQGKPNGDVVLSLEVPGPGTVDLLGTHDDSAGTASWVPVPGVGRYATGTTTATANAAGTIKVTLRLNSAAKRMMGYARRHGWSFHIGIFVTYTPVGGSANTAWTTVRVLAARKH
jgi:6-phosphogluconolactonase (cycloisomerase 2 family)